MKKRREKRRYFTERNCHSSSRGELCFTCVCLLGLHGKVFGAMGLQGEAGAAGGQTQPVPGSCVMNVTLAKARLSAALVVPLWKQMSQRVLKTTTTNQKKQHCMAAERGMRKI